MSDRKKKLNKRTLKGTVVSDKNEKTVVVRVDRVKLHPKYKKRYTVSRKYKSHDEKKEYKVGDKVMIQECRPLSKDKCWRVIGKIGTEKIVKDVEDKELEELNSAKKVEEIEKRVDEGELGDVIDEEKDEMK